MASNELVCVRDFEKAAVKRLTRNAHGYFSSGATEEQTLIENWKAFKRYESSYDYHLFT